MSMYDQADGAGESVPPGGSRAPKLIEALANERTDLSSTPRRVQLRRTKGWRMPPHTVSVARPTKWGNPFTVAEHGARLAVENYRRRLDGLEAIGALDLSELAGKNLACWCKLEDQCHADALLERAAACAGARR
jgi:hypothetical protein